MSPSHTHACMNTNRLSKWDLHNTSDEVNFEIGIYSSSQNKSFPAYGFNRTVIWLIMLLSCIWKLINTQHIVLCAALCSTTWHDLSCSLKIHLLCPKLLFFCFRPLAWHLSSINSSLQGNTKVAVFFQLLPLIHWAKNISYAHCFSSFSLLR